MTVITILLWIKLNYVWITKRLKLLFDFTMSRMLMMTTLSHGIVISTRYNNCHSGQNVH